MATTWLGDTECNFCNRDCKTTKQKNLIDGATTQGPWAVMCFDCYKLNGLGLGTGNGQKYQWDGSQFVKVAG